jgi:hypothetical protein
MRPQARPQTGNGMGAGQAPRYKIVTPQMYADLGLHIGAGDENRTRTISLGIRQIGASDRSDLAT